MKVPLLGAVLVIIAAAGLACGDDGSNVATTTSIASRPAAASSPSAGASPAATGPSVTGTSAASQGSSSSPQLSVAEGIAITSVTSPVALGGMATLTAQTSAGASCSIVYKHPSGKVSTAPGLTPQTAGSDGTVSWTWLISAGTRPAGTGTATVTCNGASAQTSLVIQ